MSVPGELDLELTSELTRLADVREQVRTWLAADGWDVACVAEITLAVDEALTNVIRHGYASEPGHRILLRMSVIADAQRGDGLEVVIRDYGKQVDPAAIHGRALDDYRPGGLGVHIMRGMMDAVEYSRAPGGGMQLVMQKYKRRSAAPDGPCADSP